MQIEDQEQATIEEWIDALESAGYVYRCGPVDRKCAMLRARIEELKSIMVETAQRCWLTEWKRRARRDQDSWLLRCVERELEKRGPE